MTAAAADRDSKFYPEGLKVAEYEVKAATIIYLGTAVAIDATGYAVPLTDSAAVTFVGMAESGVDNSAGSSGDVRVVVRRMGVISLVSSGLAITDAGCNMYFADDQTVQKVVTNQYAGKLARYTAADEAEIDFTAAIHSKS